MGAEVMPLSGSKRVRRAILSWTTIDVLLIAAISFVAEGTHFSYKQGRALICGDSAQYVASAEALLSPGKTPHFEMRKPGYILYLAGVSLAFGNTGWAAVTGHHIFMGLLPLAAYALGRHLRSRWVGWLAAILTIARLQSVVWGERMMSETLFTCLFSFGLVLFLVALSRAGSRRWMVGAGVLLGMAWLTRGAALPIIAVGVVAILVTMARDWRRALASCVSFISPVLFCVVLECSLNLAYAGQFLTSNNTVGATALLRARHFDGLELPDTPEAAQVLALLPERSREEAYVASHLDVWVARYHAVHDKGMDEWEYDNLMRRVGWDALAGHLQSYLKSSLQLTLCHLFRQADGQGLSPVPEDRRTGPLIHPAAPGDAEWDTTWFAYYGLPHMTLAESVALVDRMKTAAAQRAPFGKARIWKAFRYWKTKPVAQWPLAGLARLSSLWPAVALLGCFLLGLNRKTCAVLAAAYLLDALFIGLLTPTNARLQFIWIVIDTSLAAGAVVGALYVVVHAATPAGQAIPRPGLRPLRRTAAFK